MEGAPELAQDSSRLRRRRFLIPNRCEWTRMRATSARGAGHEGSGRLSPRSIRVNSRLFAVTPLSGGILRVQSGNLEWKRTVPHQERKRLTSFSYREWTRMEGAPELAQDSSRLQRRRFLI